MSDQSFEQFQKIPRLTRECVITETIDGTNGQILITECDCSCGALERNDCPGLHMYVGSRTRWLDAQNDNYGFYKWAQANKEDLLKLGLGRHYGEWWGQGIQRRYGLQEKRFSLFNTSVWNDPDVRPKCCGVVPIIFAGVFSTRNVDICIDILQQQGSLAAPGFTKPEGVVIYHTAAKQYFKKTLEHDEGPKGREV